MSIGFFFGIRHSFVPEFLDEARRLHEAVNDVLVRNGLRIVDDPEQDPDPRAVRPMTIDEEQEHGGTASYLGRSSIDHHGGGSLSRLGELAGKSRPHLYLLVTNPYRVVFVPRDLRAPEPTSHRDHNGAVNVGSTSHLFDELLDLSPRLGIPLENGALADDVAQQINDLEPLSASDSDVELIENIRTAWLLLHEAATLSIDLDVSLALAGG